MVTRTENLPSSQADAGVELALRRLWLKRAARVWLRGTGWIATALVAVVLVDLLLDWGLDLSGPFRLGLLGVNLVVLTVVGLRALVRHLRRFDAVDEALGVEEAMPRLDGLVVSSVQFADEAAFAPGVSRQLMRAVRRLAAQQADSLEAAMTWRRVRLALSMAFALVAVGAITAAAVFRGDYLRVLAGRMFDPSSELAYPTDTTIQVLSGDLVVRAGEPATLSARAGGVLPTAPDAPRRAFVRRKGLDWEVADVAGDAGGVFELTLRRVDDDLEYYFHLGDAKSRRHRVTAVRPPRIVERRVELTFPSYTRLTPQTVDTLNLKVPEGATATWRLKLDSAVDHVVMRPDGAEPSFMAMSADGREASVQIKAEASRPYNIDIQWRLRDRRYTETGPRHYIQVIPDADPQVGLARPVEDVKATLRKTIALSYWARDDYELADAQIVYSVNDGAELRHRLSSPAGRTTVEDEVPWEITRLLPGLKINDIVTFAIEVTDGRPRPATAATLPSKATGTARSASRRVQFVSDSEYVAYVLARQRKFLGQLRPLYLQEREAARDLAAFAGDAPTTRPAAVPSTRSSP
jgi:hypothetical protein